MKRWQHEYLEGVARIDGKLVKMPYPFPETYRKMSPKFHTLQEGNLVTLILEEYVLVSVATGSKTCYADGYRIFYPQARYKFRGYITRRDK